MMGKNRILILLVFVWVVMAGCSAEKEVFDAGSERFYEKTISVKNAEIGLYESNTVKLFNGDIYYLKDTWSEDSDTDGTVITQIIRLSSSDGSAKPELSIADLTVLAYDVYRDDYSVTYAVLCSDEAGFSVVEYDLSGLKTSETKIKYNKEKVIPKDIISVGIDSYLIVCQDQIIMLDKTGNTKRSNWSLGKIYRTITLENGEVYVSFTDDSGKSKIAKLDQGQMKPEREAEIDIQGLYLCEESGNIVISNGRNMLLYNTEDCSLEEIYDLSKNRIGSDTVRAIESTGDGFNIVCCGGTEAISLNLVKLREIHYADKADGYKYDTEGKRIVYMYCPDGKETALDSIGGIIDCFNYENPDYSIEVIEQKGTVDPVFSADMHPDIVLEEYGSKIEEYMEGGYLVDLYPYIDNSEIISREDIPEFLKDSFEIDGKLYALFRRFNINAVLVGDPDFDQKEMEPNKFIDWLSEQDEVYTEGFLDKNSLMLLCFMQTVGNFVDIDRGEVFFDNGSFAEMLTALKTRDIRETTSVIIGDYDLISEQVSGVTFVKQRIDGLKDVAQCEAALKERLCRVKLICRERADSTCFYYPYDNVGILANAECKEGAYAFIEYLMTAETNGMIMGVGYYQDANSGLCYTLKNMRDKAFAEAIGEIEINTESGRISYEINDRHRMLLNDLISDTRYLNKTYTAILRIMIEEANSYLENDKDVSEIVGIIQNRVQILLDERSDK